MRTRFAENETPPGRAAGTQSARRLWLPHPESGADKRNQRAAQYLAIPFEGAEAQAAHPRARADDLVPGGIGRRNGSLDNPVLNAATQAAKACHA
jgi:hypothetical protein